MRLLTLFVTFGLLLMIVIVRRLIIWREKVMDSPFGVAEPHRINSRQ